MTSSVRRRQLLLLAAGVGGAALAGAAVTGTVPVVRRRREQSGADASSDAAVEPVFDAFVGREGTEFVVDGEPFRFSGANNYFLTETYEAADGVVDEIVPDARELGLDVLRTWAFGAGEPGKLQPEPRTYSEREFRRLDRVVARAGREGVRLVLPLVGGWDNNGGMDQYVEWSSTAEKHNDFYTDPECRALYKDYVEYVLTRENTVTGIEYREDPTILLWELANEPHLRDHDIEEPRWQEADHRKMQAWIDEMARFVKDVDGNHLVSTGSEGLYDDGTFGRTGNRGDFVGDHRSDAVDAASFHLYERYDADPVEWVQTHVTDAHEELGKPAYLGEFGTIYGDTRAQFFADVYDAVLDSGGNGAAFWQLIGHDGRTGELRKPEADNPQAAAKAIYYPESEDVVPLVEAFSAEVDSYEPPTQSP